MKGADGMLNGIWMAMIVLAFIGAVCTGRWTALSAAAADGARQAVETVLLLLGAMCLWTGIMRIAGEAGLTRDDLVRRDEYGVVSADPLDGGHLKGFLRQRRPV